MNEEDGMGTSQNLIVHERLVWFTSKEKKLKKKRNYLYKWKQIVDNSYEIYVSSYDQSYQFGFNNI